MQVLLYLLGVALFVAAGMAVHRRGQPLALSLAAFGTAAVVLGYAWPGLDWLT